MAFSRNPGDPAISPATYTADGPSDLALIDQANNISVIGSDEVDTLDVAPTALAGSAISNYDVRMLDGDDTISVSAALIQNSVFNGNMGNDTITLDANVLSNALILGGKDNDSIYGRIDTRDLVGGEINGNIGDDYISISAGGNIESVYIGGGKDNDFLEVEVDGNIRNSFIEGNIGNDFVSVSAEGIVDSQVNGNDGNDELELNIAEGIAEDSSVNGGTGIDLIDVYVEVSSVSGNIITDFTIDGGSENDTISLFVDNNDLWKDNDEAITIIGGEGNDTIFSEANDATDDLVSVVNAGVGADDVEFDTGRQDYVYAEGDSLAATAFQKATLAATSVASAVITFGNGVDLLTGFDSGTDEIVADQFDNLDQGLATNASGFNLDTTLDTDELYYFNGTSSLVDGEFTFTVDGGGEFLTVLGGENQQVQNVFEGSSNWIITDGVQLSSNDIA